MYIICVSSYIMYVIEGNKSFWAAFSWPAVPVPEIFASSELCRDAEPENLPVLTGQGRAMLGRRFSDWKLTRQLLISFHLLLVSLW